MKPEVFKELLEKYERGQCTPDEEALIERWYDNLPVDDAEVPDETGETMWKSISDKHRLNRKGKGSKRNFFLKIAASIGLIILAGSLYVVQQRNADSPVSEAGSTIPDVKEQQLSHTFTNTTAEPAQYTLEDGSTIVLEPGSSLSYATTFNTHMRAVSLTGEAFFNITKDQHRPFYVYTREVVTKVLGTSFTIKARKDDTRITVAVRTGRVHVFANANDTKKRAASVILTPNQKIVYDRDAVEISKKLVEKPEVILEKPTLFEMKYDGVSVARIFEVLEENYGVDIQFDEEAWRDCILTTKMSDEGLLERIQIITKAIGATYSVEDAIIRIEGEGCN